jgi:hypothetical protein
MLALTGSSINLYKFAVNLYKEKIYITISKFNF